MKPSGGPVRAPLTAVAAGQFAERVHCSGGTVVFTNGVFDLLHPGHVRYLRDARALGDALVVGLNSDRSVRGNKGDARPINPEAERAELLLALGAVDEVVLFDDATPRALIAVIRPDILVKGADWAADAIVGRDTVEAGGGRVVRIPLARGFSTTALIRQVLAPGNRLRPGG